ncbi:GD15954 [Drosophila simulans]|uniref:GD15954 n=2 Tax=melanogaster subgroup TaxID=32351 RepID=B4R3K1_DROSI|nr:GD15954 [Drosophila simulans]
MYDMLKNMDPPLGFGNKCPNRLAYKKLIRMNMPLDDELRVQFTTTLFALIRENLSIKMRAPEEMDQADMELRETITNIWPLQAKKMLNLLVPPSDQLNKGKLSVGKIYAGFLILESWRSTRFGQLDSGMPMLELQDASRHPSQESLTGADAGHLHPGHSYMNGHRRSPSLRHNGSPLARSPSPRRRGHQYIHHDIGFSDTVSNVVEMVKETRHPRHGNSHPRYPRGVTHVQHSYPTLASRRAGIGRRLPPTPSKPSTLQLKPTNINFPKLNASPTHTHHSTPHSVHSLPHHRDLLRDPRDMYYSSRERERDRERLRDRDRDRDRDRLHEYDLRYEYRDRERELYERERDREREVERERLEYIAPLSFEQALAMGRTGRVLPSPVLNGFKPKSGLNPRHSDSDEEDWC